MKPLSGLFVWLAFFLISCAPKNAKDTSLEKLFSLPLGQMENEMDFFQLPGRSPAKLSFLMKDGFFYIANSASTKMMELTSYGDLLALYYDPVKSAVVEKTKNPNSSKMIRWNLDQIGEIALNNHKNLYVVDLSERKSRAFDPLLQTMREFVIKRFDENGNYNNYLGREGVGGSAFPPIVKLFNSLSDELSVVARSSLAWHIYRYFPSGERRSALSLTKEDLPILEDYADVSADIESVVLDPFLPLAYLKISFYKNFVDETTGKEIGIDLIADRIYTMDIETGKYLSWFSLPRINERSLYSYNFLGVTNQNLFYFLRMDDPTTSRVTVLDLNGVIQQQLSLQKTPYEMNYMEYYLSGDGILSALVYEELQITAIWWQLASVKL